jgi:SAM-dependent methyltransferase
LSNAHVHLVGSGSHDTATPDVHTASPEYAKRFDGPVGEWMLDRQTVGLKDLLRYMAEQSECARLRVLDVGGGHGQLTRTLLDAGHEVVVQGSSAVCFRHLRPAHPDLKSCVASSLWRLPFAEDSFDLVIGVRLLGHVRAWQALIAEMSRVSRRWVAVEFARTHGIFDMGPLGRGLFSLKRRIERTPRPFYSYSENVVAEALEECGLQVARVDAQFVLPVFLHRACARPRISAAIERALARAGAGNRVRSPVLMLAERGSTAGLKSRTRPAGASFPAEVEPSRIPV